MLSAPKAIPRVSPLLARKGQGGRHGNRGLLNDVHCRDCLELMRAMPAESVNMILADPPLNLNSANAIIVSPIRGLAI